MTFQILKKFLLGSSIVCLVGCQGTPVTTNTHFKSNHLNYKELDGDWNAFPVGYSYAISEEEREEKTRVTGVPLHIDYDEIHGVEGTRFFNRDSTINIDSIRNLPFEAKHIDRLGEPFVPSENKAIQDLANYLPPSKPHLSCSSRDSIVEQGKYTCSFRTYKIDESQRTNYIVGLTVINDSEAIISTPDVPYLYLSAWNSGFQVKGNIKSEDSYATEDITSVFIPFQENIGEFFASNYDDIFLSPRINELEKIYFNPEAIKDSSVVYNNNVDFRGNRNGISAESIVSNRKYLLLRENISLQRASEIRAKVESLKQVMTYTTRERGTKNSVEVDARVIAALNYTEDHIYLDNFRQDLLKLMLIKSQLNANLANLSRPGLLD